MIKLNHPTPKSKKIVMELGSYRSQINPLELISDARFKFSIDLSESSVPIKTVEINDQVISRIQIFRDLIIIESARIDNKYAEGFDEYWRDRVAHQDFTTGQLLADDKPEGLYNFEVGDVIMVMENGIGTHAMIITRAPEDYRNEDEVLYLSGHTNFRMDESFRDILEDMNTNTVFRFYNFHDIKG